MAEIKAGCPGRVISRAGLGSVYASSVFSVVWLPRLRIIYMFASGRGRWRVVSNNNTQGLS
jgi:hypothetical protein